MLDTATKPPSSLTAFPVDRGGRWLWVAWARRGILRRLFASKGAAEAEAAAYDVSDDLADEKAIAERYAFSGGRHESGEVWSFWWCEDLDGCICVIVEAPSRSILGFTARNRADAVRELNELGRAVRAGTGPKRN